MLFPKFDEVADSGYLTITTDTLNLNPAVEIQLEDTDRRLVVNLEIRPVDLMRALMGRGAVLCRYVTLPVAPALERHEAEVEVERLRALIESHAKTLMGLGDDIPFRFGRDLLIAANPSLDTSQETTKEGTP